MKQANAPPAEGWSVGLRVWVQRNGKALLGPGRLELLEGIDRWRSISAAARELGMSYRRAWLLVQSINEASAEPLVEAAVGGTKGGGARLTECGRRSTAIFRELQHELHAAAAGVLPRVLQLPAASPCLHVAAAISLEEVVGQLLSDYALHRPAAKVRAVFGASNELADHVLAGAPCDVFLSAEVEQLARLQTAGLCAAQSQRMLASNSLALIAPADSDLPLERPADLRRPESGRVALAEPASPLGRYSQEYLQRQGLLDALAPRAVYVDNSRAVVAALRAGRADAGLVYGSDAAAAAGCRIVFRIRRGDAPVQFWAAPLAAGQHRQAAQELLDFLTSKSAAARFRRCGFLPAAKQEVGSSEREVTPSPSGKGPG